VLKVIWGGEWDKLLEKDTTGLLKKRMEEVVDGEYQAYKAKDGAYVFFGHWNIKTLGKFCNLLKA
jgi:pyruvate dehydrogenase E1 component